jgi:RNA polymerase sigma-70 factor (ECF subfamily)
MDSDEQLMQRYLDGDQRAFPALHARYRALLSRIVRRHVFRAADVDDLVQQAFTQLHASRAQYRQGEPVRPWLCTIALNVCRDHARRRQRRPETSYEMDTLTTEPSAAVPGELKQQLAPLEAALASLSEVTQQIFHEHFMADRALVDIARDIGANPSTVRVRMHRGCAELRAALAE